MSEKHGGYEKLGNIATFAEVTVDHKSGDVKVVRVVSAFDCGAVVNPDNLRNQIEGANVQGLGGALFEARTPVFRILAVIRHP